MRIFHATPRLVVVAVCLAFSVVLSSSRAGADGANCGFVVYARVGALAPSTAKPQGPGLILMGGGPDVDAAFRWMQRTIAGPGGSDGGDVVVLRASGDNEYDKYIYDLARFNSVRTVLVPPCSSPSDLARTATIVASAQGVFFAGGDQANYVIWKGTPLASAVQHVYDRGGVVGGTSAGLAILGQYVFDAVAGDRTHDVHTPDAVADPFEPAISFTEGFLDFPPMRGLITDTHFMKRDRLGRLAAFMANLVETRVAHGNRILAVGVEQRSAVVVDARGIGTLLTQGVGRAVFLAGGKARQAENGKPLVTSPLDAVVLDRSGERFDFYRWCGEGRRYTIVVDGTRTPIYSPPNPYIAPPGSASATCH
jgi:cyanophycinase